MEFFIVYRAINSCFIGILYILSYFFGLKYYLIEVK